MSGYTRGFRDALTQMTEWAERHPLAPPGPPTAWLVADRLRLLDRLDAVRALCMSGEDLDPDHVLATLEDETPARVYPSDVNRPKVDNATLEGTET